MSKPHLTPEQLDDLGDRFEVFMEGYMDGLFLDRNKKYNGVPTYERGFSMGKLRRKYEMEER